MSKNKKLKVVIGKAVSWVSNNLDKIDTVFDVVKILGTKLESEVTQYSITVEYTTEEGKSYKLKLPTSKAKDSSELQNTIASIIVASASDLGATVEEVTKSKSKTAEITELAEAVEALENKEEPIIRKPVK